MSKEFKANQNKKLDNQELNDFLYHFVIPDYVNLLEFEVYLNNFFFLNLEFG